MTCECPGAGFCHVFGKWQSARHHAICNRNAEGLTPEKCDKYREHWAAGSAMTIDPIACIHRGPQVGERIQKVEKKGCGSCAKRGETVPVYSCALHGECTLKPWQTGQKEAACINCGSRDTGVPMPMDRTRVAPELLLPAEFQFNNSLIRYGGKLLMAYRMNWNGARVAIAELDEAYRPVANWKLPLTKGFAQEDPRLWVYRGELHVSYSAVYTRHGKTSTDVCYARLKRDGDGWTVAEEHYPHFAGRNPQWEKNWGFFEHGGELLAVYTIRPHRILRIDGDKAELIAETACDFGMKPGLMHGGAPPVLFQGEYYCFYHRRMGATSEKVYSLDLYTFDARPPFRPCRHVKDALLLPFKSDRPGPTVPHAIFPGGAFLEHNAWVVSFGYYDKWSEVARWNMNPVEDALAPVPGGPVGSLSYSEHDYGLRVWKQVNLGNEYRLPDDMTGQTVVDVGGHIGSFSAACLERGAAKVITCEPITGSRQHAAKNLALWGERVEIVPAYIVGKDDGTLRDQYQLKLEYADPEATVRTLDSVTAGLPRIDLLKLDCEGPEHGIVEHADLSRVARIVGEVHRTKGRGIETFTATLERRGFKVESEKQGDGLWLFWATAQQPPPQ